MFRAIRIWHQTRRYRAAVRKLRSLPPGELRALGIPPEDIPRLAFEMTRQADSCDASRSGLAQPRSDLN